MYKKIICMLLSLILALSTSACCCIPSSGVDYAPDTTSAASQSSSYIAGTVSSGVYTNEWLELTFKLPYGMKYDDQAVLDELNRTELQNNPNSYTLYDLSVRQTDSTNAPIQVIVQKLEDPDATLAQCLEADKQSLLELKATSESIGFVEYRKWYDPVAVHFSGHDYQLRYWISESYVDWYCDDRVFEHWDLFRIHDGHLIKIQFTSHTYYFSSPTNWRLADFVDMFDSKDTDISAFHHQYDWGRHAWIGAGFGTLEGSRMDEGVVYTAMWEHSDGSAYTIAITLLSSSEISMVITDGSGAVVDQGYGEYRSPGGYCHFSVNWDRRGYEEYDYFFDPLNLTLTQVSYGGFAGSDQKPDDILYLER